MSIKNLYLTASMTMIGLAFTACSHDDFIDNNAPVNNLKAEYADNFVKKYGAINPNQTWDFSSAEPTYSLFSSNVSAARTRTGEGSFDFEANTSVNSIVVEKSVLEWMYTNMPKGKNNQGMGKAFFMTVPDNPFTVAPIYQGCANYYWELWMNVKGIGDYKIWSKGENFFYQDLGDGDNWTALGVGKDGLAKDNNGQFNHEAVKAPTYTFTNLPVGAEMTFYLKVWQNGSGLGYDAYKKYLENPNNNKPLIYTSSDVNNCRMISLTKAQKPAAVPDDYDVTIIGCEDGTDKDFEDLVFMVYGKPVPPTERVKEIESSLTKRYFMEDLGTTDDFDFNDVVVDVKYNRKKITIIYDNTTDEELKRTEEDLPDVAIVRATGGTLDFTLTIGETTWIKSEHKDVKEMWNTGWGGASIDYTAVLGEPFKVKGFIPDNNNISVEVVDRGGSGEVKTITFPKKGEAPMMLAVGADVNWMNERVSIPKKWFDEE